MVSYNIHLDSPGPFGSALNTDDGFFNWAMVLMYSPILRAKPVSLRLLDVPPAWALRDVHVLGGAGPGKVSQAIGIVRNYDELVDSPAEVGTFQQSMFQEDGATYRIVVDGNPADYNMAKLQEVLRKITHAAVDWMQDRPYDEYTFLYHFPRGQGGGGMEHAYGTAIEVSAERLGYDLSPVANVSAHEFFHLWNVKRIRPQSLEPIDYQRGNETRALWFSEGVTSTVADILLARAGLIDEAAYLQHVSAEITELQRRPAHTWQSAEESSLDAWFEGNAFYRTPERSISYYNKGDILGVLLDLRIRELTGDSEVTPRFVPVDERPLCQAARFLSGLRGSRASGRGHRRPKLRRLLPRLCRRSEGNSLRRILPVCGPARSRQNNRDCHARIRDHRKPGRAARGAQGGSRQRSATRRHRRRGAHNRRQRCAGR